MLLVGLTGGIGSGKSTVARLLAARGCRVIDADRVARAVVEPGRPALDEVVAAFGTDVLAPDGTLDRSGLAARVFHDKERRHVLERITHPRIAAGIAEEVAAIVADPSAPADTIVVVDHPLLVETGQMGRFDEVIVVTASEATRLERLTAQRGLDAVDVRARIAAQTDDATRREAATILIDNDGAPIELEAQVVRVHDRLVETARRH